MADDQVFKPGDVVKLNSGGPAMTVQWYGAADKEVSCKWWNAPMSKFETERHLATLLHQAIAD